MKITVTKSPDGVLYMTKDGHGELFAGEIDARRDIRHAEGAEFGDNTIQLFTESPKFEGDDPTAIVRFSYVDYLDTANRDVPGDGVRQFFDRQVPGRFDFGPYVVEVAEQ